MGIRKDIDLGQAMPVSEKLDYLSWAEARAYCLGWNDYRDKMLKIKREVA